MVLDSLTNAFVYEPLHPLFKRAFDYIKQTDWSKAELGRIELDGDNLYINYMEATGKTTEEAKLESHQAYIDIQVPLSAPESIGYAPICDLCQPDAPYDPAKDITFYSDKTSCLLNLKPRHFAIFWPDDGHQPCIGTGSWRKIVVKVKL